MYEYLIIGNGIAGLSAAEEIRKNDQDSSILIISEERCHTYWRTKLSALICKDFSNDDILVRKESWYKEKNIEEILGVKVDKIESIRLTGKIKRRYLRMEKRLNITKYLSPVGLIHFCHLLKTSILRECLQSEASTI